MALINGRYPAVVIHGLADARIDGARDRDHGIQGLLRDSRLPRPREA